LQGGALNRISSDGRELGVYETSRLLAGEDDERGERGHVKAVPLSSMRDGRRLG
jgi:hypothetical protein